MIERMAVRREKGPWGLSNWWTGPDGKVMLCHGNLLEYYDIPREVHEITLVLSTVYSQTAYELEPWRDSRGKMLRCGRTPWYDVVVEGERADESFTCELDEWIHKFKRAAGPKTPIYGYIEYEEPQS